MDTKVDVVVLTPRAGPLHPEVALGLDSQIDVQIILHRIIGQAQPHEYCRYETIARMRNEGKQAGDTPLLMFVDHDVVLEPRSISILVSELSRRPVFAALAADYLGEHRQGEIAPHVAMGATLFRRKALEQIKFNWEEAKCDCQCCCDDLRRLHWGINYCSTAKARHLSQRLMSDCPQPDTEITCESVDDSARRQSTTISGYTPTVCLVACYFGPPPRWINHYLLSCEHNPSIDFLIVTDQDDFPPVPANVRVKRLSVSFFNALATTKLGVPIDLSHPRKLCDFKPAYGHLFEECLEGFDYWGYTDFDVIYGNIRRFLSAECLENYDVFTARKEYLVGHFTLLRNVPRLRTLYQQCTGFRAIMQFPEVLSFDECGQQWESRMRGEPLSEKATCDSMTHVVNRLAAESTLNARFSPAVIEWPEIGDANWRLRWEAGQLWNIKDSCEVMYVHFHAFKGNQGYQNLQGLDSQASFEITPQGFESARSERKVNETTEPRILVAFNRQHLELFNTCFMHSLRQSENDEEVVPVAIGLSSADREQLLLGQGVKPTFRNDSGECIARRRLRDFAEITRELPPSTPVAYWDAGDVVFQSRLEPLWRLIRANPGKLLVVREPSGHPHNPVTTQWTETIFDYESRLEAQQLIFSSAFLNGGFLAGTASVLAKYFETVAVWYETPKLAGSTDPGDQLGLNVYCHSQPHVWEEIPEGWNYCLWGRVGCFQRTDGRYIDIKGVPIHVVHGNAHTLKLVPSWHSVR